MFEIVDYTDSGSCVLCEKDANLVVKCKAGTLHGPLCLKCLIRQAKARKGAKEEQPALFPQRA